MYYIVKTGRQVCSFYYARERGIVRRVFVRGRWQPEEVIAQNARENFTVHLDNGVIYLFCQDAQGNMVLITINTSDNSFNAHVALENKADHVQAITLYPIIMEQGLVIIYNTAAEDHGNYLMIQKTDGDGQWSPATRIDKYWSSSYDVQRISNDHLVVFYQTRGRENSLGYRELTAEEQGRFNIFYSTGYFVSDTAYLTTEHGIHTLFVVKSMFSSQLIYRSKISGEFNDPVVIYEAQRIERCLLFFIRGKLYVTFLAAGQLFMCESTDMGGTFTRPARYRNKFCQNPEKAYFICDGEQTESECYIRQVYVDHSTPWDVQIVPELYEDFYMFQSEGEDSESASMEPEYADELGRLKNQLEQAQRQLAEKDSQLAQLAQLLSQRNQELGAVMYQRQGQEASNYSYEDNYRLNEYTPAELRNEAYGGNQSADDNEQN
jgi:hypothetical protein